MEKKEMGVIVKTEDAVVGSSSFVDYPFSSAFDFSEVEKSSLGFMELLGGGVHQYNNSPLLDLPQLSTTMPMPHHDIHHHTTVKAPSSDSEVLNHHQPATPNSSSISSASSEALNDEHNNTLVVDEEDKQKTNKLLKVKKTNQKREREPRFAFMTKSEVDHLEDGYRWRKYGQKAVKNSPFPRSYYRCTTATCNVKKRVERSFIDPTIVVTTYEGQHTHPSPAITRSGLAGAPISPRFPTNFASLLPPNYLLSQQYQQNHHHQQQQQQQLLVNTLSSFGFPYKNSSSTNDQERQLCNPGTRTTAFLSDNGLLQDVVPSHMLKEE